MELATNFSLNVPLHELVKATVPSLFKAAAATAQNPSMTNVHQLRRILRKVRTFLWLVPRRKKSDNIQHAVKSLRKLNQSLGKLRGLHVALKDAKAFNLPTKSLTVQITSAKAKVRKELTAVKRTQAQKAVNLACTDLAQSPPDTFQNKFHKTLKAVLRASQKPPKDDEERHNLRIAVKKINVLCDATGTAPPELVLVQKRLGRWHNLIVLEELYANQSDVDLSSVVKERRQLWSKSKKALSAIAHQKPAESEILV